MPIEVLMPALSPTMTEGTLAKWLKKEGDTVEAGDVIAEIETDKATMEVEAVDEGEIGKILIDEGTENVPVNKPIALLLEEGEDKKALEDYKPSEPEPPKAEAEEGPAEEETPKSNGSGGGGQAPAAPAASPGLQAPSFAPPPPPPPTGAAMPSPATAAGGRVFASPLARRIAEERGINLHGIQGSGPHGRIIRSDVENAPPGGMGGFMGVRRNPTEYDEIKNTGMRKTIAKRLLESKQWVPHFYLTVDCEIDALLDVRKQLNAEAVSNASEGKPAYKLSVNDMIIKAVAMALRKVPEANAMWTDDAILQFNNVDISVAVAIEGGLVTPIIRNADQKPVTMISNEMKELAVKAREGKLKPEEYQGGGFSISNLGMFGIKEFSAIINPPQSCILAVGAGEEQVKVRDGNIKTVHVMNVTLSCDHRVVDGAVGAQFLQAFKHYIQSPATMLV